MTIEKDSVVQFHYSAKEGDTELESTYGDEPVLYLHGHDNLMPALEEALSGKSAGDDVSITLPPEQAYGERTEAEPRRVPIKHLVTKGKIKPGMIVQVNTEHGPMEAVVVKVGLKNIDIDTNHPYAGKTLTFEIKILDVRPATPEELAHGHAHGIGGHHHH
ncbi:peptidylprolyl isomerase [Halioxenophilus sp. WMMB6]|uniref:FKBP-type peptidyl-prolyl cis-trans isomerase n=1 Tax=Halioxenophilus sp. WMMB6 TaxID=3073815 RepID=UPI00295E938E|nr:peptidylprolyl isomerase [Halioxenophilus sp. WMMB6]